MAANNQGNKGGNQGNKGGTQGGNTQSDTSNRGFASMDPQRQREIASSWLRQRNPWEIQRGDARYVIRFGGRCIASQDAQGRTRYRWVDTRNIWAVGFDQFIPGNRSPTVNHLRLWAGRAIAPFDVAISPFGR